MLGSNTLLGSLQEVPRRARMYGLRPACASEGKLDVAGAREPGLGIVSPTMPGIGENHTHRSRGSLWYLAQVHNLRPKMDFCRLL